MLEDQAVLLESQLEVDLAAPQLLPLHLLSYPGAPAEQLVVEIFSTYLELQEAVVLEALRYLSLLPLPAQAQRWELEVPELFP